jgi:hypothetical protein
MKCEADESLSSSDENSLSADELQVHLTENSSSLAPY